MPRNIASESTIQSSIILGLSHVSLVVPDLDAAAARLKEIYGLELGDQQVNQEQGVRLAYVDLGNARIELMSPLRPDSPVAKFLERNPHGGIHHVCLAVDNVEAMSRAIIDKGARVLGDGQAQHNVHGERIAFVHPRDFLGALLELEEKRPEQ
jgi:methylmalonyl-CoA/ethylmalonyl-CoA epimerase